MNAPLPPATTRFGRYGVEWLISRTPQDYPAATAFMERRAGSIAAGTAAETVWLLEHPPLYTAGTSADPSELTVPGRFPVYSAGRGGRFTYHGPGQRIAYVMLDLSRRGRDVRRFVVDLESWIVRALAAFSVMAECRDGLVGVWVCRGAYGGPAGRYDKIAAIGVRIRRWVTFHGLSINVAPDLEHYGGIVPCGIRDDGVTSLDDLGVAASVADVDRALIDSFGDVFGSAG